MMVGRILAQAAAGSVILVLIALLSRARAIELLGVISECYATSFTPIADVLVKVFDEDLESSHGLMGEARTDINGRYKLVYEDIEWNLGVRRGMYIEVYDRVRGREIKINRNHKLRLTIFRTVTLL